MRHLTGQSLDAPLPKGETESQTARRSPGACRLRDGRCQVLPACSPATWEPPSRTDKRVGLPGTPPLLSPLISSCHQPRPETVGLREYLSVLVSAPGAIVWEPSLSSNSDLAPEAAWRGWVRACLALPRGAWSAVQPSGSSTRSHCPSPSGCGIPESANHCFPSSPQMHTHLVYSYSRKASGPCVSLSS